MTAPMDHAAAEAYLREAFPQMFEGQDLTIEAAADGTASLKLRPSARHLRPGGVISGPTLMMLADAAAYVALLSRTAGAKMAVTSNLSIAFLSAGSPGHVITQSATIIKAGRRLATLVCEAHSPAKVCLAHATLTYAMPPEPDPIRLDQPDRSADAPEATGTP